MDRYVIAEYIRLSLEDAKSDSQSIPNQRLIMEKHIASLGIPDAEVLEFMDNGYSGTNFERPAVQELISLVREGKVQCIIVKDFSRFGRNSIETAYFIERVFPLYRTRFISVSDSFDSDEHKEDAGSLDVAFKFLLHEYFSIDLSRKIKSAVLEKKRKGEYITKNCPFGYKKVGGCLEIDPPAAETVRMIFSLALEGKRASQIVACLYEAKRPTPGEHTNRARRVTPEGFSCVWTKSMIWKILNDEQYIGTYIACKTRTLEVGSRVAVKNDESEWIRIPNHHPAIVERSVFETNQVMTHKNRPPMRKQAVSPGKQAQNSDLPLKGKVACGCCSHLMTLSQTKNAAFQCLFTRAAPDAECHKLKVSAMELASKVFKAIQKQAYTILDTPDTSKPENDGLIEQMLGSKRKLYERFVLGEISEDDFREQNAVYDTELLRVKQIPTVQNSKHDESRARVIAGDVLKKRRLTTDMADDLIERVRVFPDGRLEVAWKVAGFADTVG